MEIFKEVKFDERGLIPAIVQDAERGQVLMLAYMNRDSLQETLRTGFTHFFSRSRNKIWKKGEESGHVQRVREILYDCDGDTILLKVNQEVAACHTGHRSCFYRCYSPSSDQIEEVEPRIFDPDETYRKGR